MKENAAHNSITFRPITDEDLDFLYNVYASTRLEELESTGWPAEEIEKFLHSQFTYQHIEYTSKYKNAEFDIISINGIPAGRLYVDRRENEIRIMDIALLPDFRRKGIGTTIMSDLIAESEEKQVILSLHVEQYNPAMGLYERLGFKAISQQGVYYLMVRKPGNPG